MFEKIVRIKAQDHYQLIAEFSDGVVKQYDAYPVLTEIEEFQVLLVFFWHVQCHLFNDLVI